MIRDFKKISEGVSSSTYIVNNFSENKYVLKTPNNNSIISKRRIRWEYEIQKYLYGKFPVPKVINYFVKNNRPFLLIEFIDGQDRQQYMSAEDSFDLLLKLHNVEIKDEMINKKQKNYLFSFVNFWSDRYNDRKIDNDLDIIVGWINKNIPSEIGQCIVHNDWKRDNIIFYKNSPTVIDWEMSGIGDPRIDFSIALSYLDKKTEKKIINSFENNNPLYIENIKYFQILSLIRLLSIYLLAQKKYEILFPKMENLDIINYQINEIKNKCEELMDNE